MDIMEPRQNASTEQKQLALSYQGLMRQRARRRNVNAQKGKVIYRWTAGNAIRATLRDFYYCRTLLVMIIINRR